jgi:hypothetical protein
MTADIRVFPIRIHCKQMYRPPHRKRQELPVPRTRHGLDDCARAAAAEHVDVRRHRKSW